LKHGVPKVVVDARNTSNECPKCDFEGNRDEIGKPNIRKRALKRSFDPPTVSK